MGDQWLYIDPASFQKTDGVRVFLVKSKGADYFDFFRKDAAEGKWCAGKHSYLYDAAARP